MGENDDEERCVEKIYALLCDAEMCSRVFYGCRMCSEFHMLLMEKCFFGFTFTACMAMSVIPLSLQSARSSTPAGRGS